MLRPEQMSKVSVAGSRSVMEPVIETVHGMNLVHLSDYDGSWEGFENGDPIEGSERASEKLVTVRALESILDLEGDDAGPSRIVTREEIDDELDGIREEVNELDDRRDAVRNELREVTERIKTIRPFVDLGIDLDLLGGYDSLEVQVGQGDLDEIEAALADEESVDAYETFTGDGVVAVFAHPADGAENVIDDALVGVEFTTYEVPDSDRAPEEFLAELRERKRELEAQRDQIQTELDELREEVGGFLLAAEEKLSIDVQRAEAPLQFATSKRAFIAEGWIPTERYDEFESKLREVVGDSLEIEELVVAEYDDQGHATHAEEVEHEAPDGEPSASAPDEEEPPKAATDGGHSTGAAPAAGGGVAMMNDAPPVVQDNADIVQPFEMLVNTVNHPKYTELDPTLLVFLTFPFAFGFMIGDIGYGILYGVMGYALLRYDSMAMQAMGAIAIWAGIFTTVFGYLYDDIFGVHMADLGIHLPLAGVISKGITSPEFIDLWLVAAVLFGVAMLSVGWIIGFFNDLHHGVKEAALENLSWVVGIVGFFMWVFSLHLAESKPDFIVGPDAALANQEIASFLTFTGLPEPFGYVGLGLLVAGLVGIYFGEGGIGLVETPAYLFGHSLSFLRIPAVLLAKGGMAFAVNVLVFGQYVTADGSEVFGLPTEDVGAMEASFVGLIHIDAVPFLLVLPIAILIFVAGHFLVLMLGITAAGIQMIRLEYVEFFQKFYEGGGERYEPFGYDRNHTTQD